MYVNINKLKGKLVEKGISVVQLAERMGINKATMYRKLENGGLGLSVKDANLIVEILGLTLQEAMEIFFAKKVALYAT